MTKSERIKSYIADNPGANAFQIARELGIDRAYILVAARRLEHRRCIESMTANRSGRPVTVFYRYGETPSARTVFAKAARIGHPFGIVAAQVMA